MAAVAVTRQWQLGCAHLACVTASLIWLTFTSVSLPRLRREMFPMPCTAIFTAMGASWLPATAYVCPSLRVTLMLPLRSR